MISHKIQDSFRDFYPRRSLQKRAFQMKLPQPVQIPLERAASKLNIKLTYFDSNSPIGLQILGGYSWWSFTDTKDLQGHKPWGSCPLLEGPHKMLLSHCHECM